MVETDLELVLAWRNNPAIRRYMYTQQEISFVEHKHWFELARQDQRRHLLIFESDSEPLGFISFCSKKDGSVADWGFYIAPNAPKGSGRKLGKTALDYAFGALHLHKVCGEVLTYNERSVHFHQSLVFSVEGRLREQHFDGGKYHDVMCFGLLASEWCKRPSDL